MPKEPTVLLLHASLKIAGDFPTFTEVWRAFERVASEAFFETQAEPDESERWQKDIFGTLTFHVLFQEFPVLFHDFPMFFLGLSMIFRCHHELAVKQDEFDSQLFE